jgi:hypothetical protein
MYLCVWVCNPGSGECSDAASGTVAAVALGVCAGALGGALTADKVGHPTKNARCECAVLHASAGLPWCHVFWRVYVCVGASRTWVCVRRV